jgi:trehalose 6-phosphate phosphatase
MRNLLAAANAEVLARFAWSRVLVGLDFDGTLAPIVERPEDAYPRERTHALLHAVARRYPVAVISGRSRADVARRVTDVPLVAVVGNHGLEPGADVERCRGAVARWMPRLTERLRGEAGIEIEDKGMSLAIHYRGSRVRWRARQKIRLALASLGGGMRLIGGKMVVNVLPSGAPHKGIALLRAREHAGVDTAIYVGDDATDEDVFTLDDPGRLLSVRVGRSARSSAQYYVATQRDVDVLLAKLVELRPNAAEAVGS